MPRYDVDSLENRSPEVMDRLARFIEAVLGRWHPHHVTGLDRLPDEPVLFVGNHSGAYLTVDSYLFCEALYRAKGLDAVPYGLAHEWVMRTSPFNEILAPMGGVRACHENARRLFEAGRNVLVYPGGDIDAMRPYARRNEVVFGHRRGFVRLALEAGVPVVPVVAAGAHDILVVLSDMQGLARLVGSPRWMRVKVWPLTFSIPFGLSLGPFFLALPLPAPICIEVGEPIRFERSGHEAAEDEAYVAACAAQVQGEMQRMLTRLADERRRRWPRTRDVVRAVGRGLLGRPAPT